MLKYNGVSLLELLIACVILVVISIPLVDILNHTFMAEYHNRVSAENKVYRSSALQLIAANLKSASYIYTSNVTIPTEKSTFSVIPESNGIAFLIPVVDASGLPVRSSGETQFDAYAYALIPESDYYTKSSSSDVALVASHTTLYCASTSQKPYNPSASCATSWTDADTNVIFNGAKPGIMDGYSSSFSFDDSESVKNNVTIVFATYNGNIYYASDEGTTIPDKNVVAHNVLSRNISY